MIAELVEVSKSYITSPNLPAQQVLNRVSLTVHPAETISIMGPSGSGKSTLLNLIGLLDQPDRGTIHLNGKAVQGMKPQEVARLRNQYLGMIFQQHYLLPQLTLLENVLLPMLAFNKKEETKKRVDRVFQLAKQVGLMDHLHKFPSQLSVGECQRGALIRAFIQKPSLILADEPTGALDATNAEALADLLLELNQEEGVALIVVTHASELAAKMKTRYQLKSGQLQLQA